MNLSATIAKMRAAGMSSEAILLALECVVVEPSTPEKSGAARRQAAYRERLKQRNETHNVTHNVDNSVTVKEKVSHTLPKEKINTPTRARAAVLLPDDWEPNAKAWALADELGFTTQEVSNQVEVMRDWSKSKGERRSDWDAQFRNWLKRHANDRRNRPQAPQRNSLQNALAAIDFTADEAIRRTGGYGAESGEADTFELPGLRKSAA